jgi:hypothetical protein
VDRLKRVVDVMSVVLELEPDTAFVGDSGENLTRGTKKKTTERLGARRVPQHTVNRARVLTGRTSAFGRHV